MTAQSLRESITAEKLPNGLQLYFVQKRDIPMVTVLIAVRNGSFAETEANNGLAHLYEHMFFKANEKIPSQPQFLRALDELGVELGPNMNATTSTEAVRYFFTIQSRYLDQGIQFMSDALQTPLFVQEELERERKVVIGEFDRFEASPTDVFYQQKLFRRLFPQTFVRKNVIGQRSVILSATREQMHEIKDRYYIPNNSALFVVGDFELATARQWIERSFGNWKPGEDPFQKYPVAEEPPLPQSEKFQETAAVNTVNLVLAQHGPRLTLETKDLIALDLLSVMLGLESSLFQKELVHSGLATSASFSVWDQRFISPLFFALETTPENSQKAYEKLMELRSRFLADDFLTEKDLQLAKTAIEVSTAYERESGQRFANNLANVWCSTGSLDHYFDYLPTMNSVSLADLRAVVKKYVLERPFVLGALRPSTAPEIKFQEAL